MYDITIPHKEYTYEHLKILWFFEDGKDMGKSLANNVYICDENYHELWNMRHAQGFDDVCTMLTMKEHTFYMYTFCGCGITIDLRTLAVVEKKLVR